MFLTVFRREDPTGGGSQQQVEGAGRSGAHGGREQTAGDEQKRLQGQHNHEQGSANSHKSWLIHRL